MNIDDIRGHGHYLATIASIRVLAMQVSKIANPTAPEAWFTGLGQKTFDYVDGTTHPDFTGETLKAIKEAAYDTLRMAFDPKGFKV